MSVDPSTSAEPMNKENIGADSGMSEAAVEQPQQQPLKPARNDQNAMFLRASRAGNLDQVLEFLRAGIDINTCNSNGLNALHLASKEGHNEVVRELLRRGAAVDAATRKGNTALHIASLAGQDIIVTILVEHGANVNAQSLNGFSPLYMAAQENHEMVVRYLLAHGANQALATEDGFTPLAVALQQGHDRIVALLLENDNTSKVKLPALHIAAKKDDTRAATLLLQNEQNPNVTSKSGFTPLHIASHYGNEGIAQLLIEKGANVNFQARHNISPLHVAAKWGRVKLVELLLDRGAIIDCRTRDLLTPLHCAARSGHDAVVEVLLDRGAPIAAKTKNGLAPLHMAAQGDHVDCARILLYHRANVDEVTVDYLTPLHVAAHCGHVGVAKLLLDRQADPNARALNGFTPLHIACKKNRIKVVELLLKYHASVEATTESGLAPLHVAAFMGCINIVIFLLQQGANVNCETVRGETPLHLAARANQTDIVRVLVRNKANVDAQARELQTPLHIAARLGNADIAHILLNAHANPNAATQDQYTPLHIAAKEGQEEVVQLLLEKKANKTLLTKKGFSPLHLAAKYGNYAVVKLLLDRGTPVDIEGKNQVTPLHVASHYNNERVAQLLLESGARAQACAKNGYTPLHIAAKKNQMEIAHALLAYRADPNAESRAGFTPLHLASEEGHVQMVVLLTEKGSQVNARAKNGLTPMHLCAQEDRVDVADQLFANGANVNEQTNAGYTPLHVACHFGQIAMVKWLIEHGANVDAETRANYTPLHQAAQQGHNHVVRYLLEHGASPNTKTASGQTPLAIAQRLGYVSVVETLRTVTETTVITETTTITEERYRPQNPEAMNETMFSDSEDEADDHQAATAEHARDFNESITQGLRDSAVVHLIHTGEQQLNKSGTSPFDMSDADLEAVIKRAQQAPISTAIPDPSFLDNGQDDNVALSRHELIQPSFLISFLVDARGGAMRGCRHSGVRVIIPPRKAAAPIRITCRYLKKEKLSHPPPLSEGEALASRILEMGPHGAKFLGPVILEVPHFASLRGREREIVILRSDDGQHWKEHQLEATEDAVQEVLNESFDAQELQQLDELHTSRITRILTSDFPMYFAVVTRVRQEVHCVGPEGGVILSSVVPRVQAIFPDGSLTKTIKVSLQAQPVPQEIVTKLHGNRVAVSPIVTVEPRRRKFHKPITLCIPLPQSTNKGMLTQHQQQPPAAQEKHGKEQTKEPQPQQEPPTLRLLCSITGGSAPAQWEDITGTTQLTFTGDEISFTTTVSARFWLMDCQTPRDAARMAQEIYQETIAVPFMAKFVIFARRPFPTEGQLRMFCMTDDKEEKTLEKQEGFQQIAKSRDVEVLGGRHQWLEFAGNLVPVTKRGDQLSIFFQPFQENRLAFNIKVKQQDDQEAASAGKVAVMKEPRNRADTLPPQHPICTLTITLPDYSGPLPALQSADQQKKLAPISQRYADALSVNPAESYPNVPLEFVAKSIGADWARLGRALGVHPEDIRQIRREMNSGSGLEPISVLKIWISLKGTSANEADLEQALRQIGRDDIVHRMTGQPDVGIGDQDGMSDAWRASQGGTPVLRREYSSKSSLGGGGAHIVQSAPVAAALSATTVSSTAGFSPTPSSVVVEQPIEPLENVETVVTRTERFVHHSEEANEPVVDEKITQQIFRDGQEIQHHEMELHDQSLNEQEQAQWESMGDAEERDRLARSREAMIIDGEERHLIQVDDGGRPIEQTTVQTTTLITSEHQMPIEEAEEEPKVQEPKEPSLQREPSQGSEGSVVIHSEEPVAQEQQQIALEQHEPEQQPLAEQFQTSTTTTASTVSSAAQPQGYEAAGEEGSSTAGDEARGANHLEPAKSDKNGQEEQQIGEEWTRGPPDVQQSETMDESFPMDEGAQMITKKWTHILSTSQSKVQGLEDLENAPAPASGTQSTHTVTVHSSGPPQKEDNSLSLSLTTSTSSTSSSVKEKVAKFESMAAADKEAEEAAAKKRFGWRPPSRESARSAVTEAHPTMKRGEDVQEESGAKSSRIPTRSPTSPSRASLRSPVHVKKEDETAANVEAVITLERQPEEVHLKYSTDEEAAAIHKASQPADSTKHEAMVGIANERIIDDSAPEVTVSHSQIQESPEPAIIIVEASSHELSTIRVKDEPISEELMDEKLHHKEVVKVFEATNEEAPAGPICTKTGKYVPFGAEIEADQREKPESEREGAAEEKVSYENKPIDTAQEERFKLRRVSMDTDKVENREKICIESPAEESEAIREQFSREIRPELFVTTGLDLHKIESSDAKMVEKEQQIPLNEEEKMSIEEEESNERAQSPEEIFDKKEAFVEELQQAPSVKSGEHLPETELQTEIHYQLRPENLIIHSSEQETDRYYGEEKEPKYITEKIPSEEILVRKNVTPENIMDEIIPVQNEMRSTVWLCTVPVQNSPYEEEELDQMKALFWPEDDKRIDLKHAPVAEIPFWFNVREVAEEIQPSPKLESHLNDAEAIQKEQQLSQEQQQQQTEEEVQERKEFEEEQSVPGETYSTGEGDHVEFLEENKQETKINFDYPTTIEESTRIEPKAVEIEQSAMETTEMTISSQKVPPPLSPLQSEESITREESLLGGSTDDDGDERSSIHTVIHRPDVLVEIESSQTRSLYGTVEGQESDLKRTGFDEPNTQGVETNTPTTPVMNASRWKSLDDRSSFESHHTPSPIIEITPAADDEKSENEEPLPEHHERLEEAPEREETEDRSVPLSEEKEAKQPEEIETIVAVPMPESEVHEKVLIATIPQQIHEAEESVEQPFEEKQLTGEVFETTEEIEEDEGIPTPENSPLQEEQQTQKTVRFEFEDEELSQKKVQETPAESEKPLLSEQIASEEDLLVDSEPLSEKLELEQIVHFDEEGHSPKRTPPNEVLPEEAIKFEDEEEEDIDKEFEIVDSSEVPVEQAGEQQAISPEKEKINTIEVEKSPEESKPQTFSEIRENRGPELIEPQPTLPTHEEEEATGIEEEPESKQDFKGDEKKMEEEQKVREEEIQMQKESRKKEEDEASLLGMASAIQAEILVEEALSRVLADGIPSPEQSQKPSPEPASDDWELLGEEKETKMAESVAVTTAERSEDLRSFAAHGTDEKPDDHAEKDSTMMPHAEIPREEFRKQEEPEESYGGSDEEDAELVQLHIGRQEEEAESAESPEQYEPEENKEQISEEPTTTMTTGASSLLAPMVPIHRPKSPIPPPVAATPPQFQKIEQSEVLESGDEMLLTESVTKMPEDVLDLGDEYEHTNAEPMAVRKPSSPPDTTDLMRVHEEMLSTGGESLEPGDEGSSGDAGPSLTSSPSKKRRSTSSSLQGGLNGAGGAGSTEGSLLEFERLEQEVIDETHSELAIPKGGIIDETEKSGSVSAAHVAVARESADSISGSVSSLTEFEQLEREVREAVGLTGEEIMMLSDIREESEEGIVEEEQPEEDDVERMSTKEDDDEEMKPLSNEELSKTEDNIKNLHEDKESVDKVISIEPAMLSSADSLEVERTQHLLELEQPMETSVDSLELNRGKEAESTGENDSLEGEANKPESPTLIEERIPEGKALEVPTSSGNGNGSPTAETGEAEQTVFETTRINPTDGSADRLIRTAITRVRDPIHSRVRFVGTEDEQQVQAILDGAGGGQEMEVVDEEGNVTHLSIRTEHEAVH